MFRELVKKQRTVKAKCTDELEHLKIEVTSAGTCEPGELPDNPLKMQNGDECPVCGSPVEVLDHTEEIEE